MTTEDIHSEPQKVCPEGFYKIRLRHYYTGDTWTVGYHHGDNSWALIGGHVLVHTKEIAEIGERITVP